MFPTQPNFTYSASSVVNRVAQLAIRKAPIRHNGDFHPGRQHLPQPAQHLVLIAPLIPLQRRGRQSSTAGASRAHGQSPSPARSCCLSAAKLVQSSATTTSVRAPTMNGVQYAKKVQTSTPRLLRSRSTCFTRRHAWSTYPWPGPSRAHCMDCQRSARQHAKGGVGQRQHSFGMRRLHTAVMKRSGGRVSGAIARMSAGRSGDVDACNHPCNSTFSAPLCRFIMREVVEEGVPRVSWCFIRLICAKCRLRVL